MRPPSSALDVNDLDSHVRGLLDEQRVEIRKDVLVSMETVARQTGSRLAKGLEERLEAVADRQPPPGKSATLPLIVLIVLLFVSMAWNLLLSRQKQDVVLADNNDAARLAVAEQAEDAVARLRALQTETLGRLASSWKGLGWAMNQSLEYPYDEIALDKGRVELIEQLLVRLNDVGYQGKVTLETHVGEFCLMGNQDSGFRLPAPDLTVDQCEFIGNPVQPTDSPGAHQSLLFANFVNSTPLLEQDDYVLEIVAASREEPLYAYPARSAETTAQSWNEIALRNNRVVLALDPQG
jgi:hypothetical protein